MSRFRRRVVAAVCGVSLLAVVAAPVAAASLPPGPVSSTAIYGDEGLTADQWYPQGFNSSTTPPPAYMTVGGVVVPFSATGTAIVPCNVPQGPAEPVIDYSSTGQAMSQPGTTPVSARPPLPAFNSIAPLVGGETVQLSTVGGASIAGFFLVDPPYLRTSYLGQSLPLSSIQADNGYFSVTLPLGVRSGSLTVSVCSAQETLPFSVSAPTISSAPGEIDTSTGSETNTAGQSITLSGANFAESYGGGNEVLLNGSPLTDITSWADNSITAVLPASLGTGIYPLAVQTGGGASNVVQIAILAADGAAEAATHIPPPTSNHNPAYVGQDVTYTAAVVATSGAVPTGTVTFLDGGAPVAGCAAAALSALGIATCDPTYSSAGTRQITASYGGGAAFLGSTSQPLAQSVILAPTSTALGISPSPSTYGQPVGLTAAVSASSGTPGGTVTFRAGTTTLGSATLSGGTADLTTAALPPGTDTVTASYGGSTAYAGSTGSATEDVAQPAPAPLSASAYLPGGQVGAPYSGSVTAGGGTPPYTWSVTGGSLPAGLSLGAGTGVVSGTPTAAGTSSYTVTVRDSAGHAASASGSITVAATATNPLQVATQSLPGGQVGSAYSGDLAASGGIAPYAWTLTGGSLPAGLSLTTAGAVYGTPTAAGTSDFQVRVTDARAQTATASLSLAVAPTASGGGSGGSGGSGGGTTRTVTRTVYQPQPYGVRIYVPVYRPPHPMVWRYDPAPFFPHEPYGYSPLRLGVYAYRDGGWSYAGGEVHTTLHTVTLPVPPSTFVRGTRLRLFPVTTRFSDVPAIGSAAWYTAALDACLGHHVIRGFPGGTFRPGAAVTRAQFAAMLVRALRLQPGAHAPRFTDVTVSAWYSRVVEAAASAGLIRGFPGGTFQPNAPIQRDQAAAMLLRSRRYTQSHPGPWQAPGAGTGPTVPYTDQRAIPAWAAPDVARARVDGLLVGFPDGQYRPGADLSRAQAVEAVARLLRQMRA